MRVQAEVSDSLGPEASVDEVHLGVLDASTVEVDVHPVVGHVSVEAGIRIIGIHVAHEVPRRVDESVHRVGLTSCCGSAARAVDVEERRRRLQRIPFAGEIDIIWQFDGKIRLGHRHLTTFVAMDDGDRRTPVALPADSPVTQLPPDRALAGALLLQHGDHGADCVRAGQSVEAVTA